MIKNRIEFVGSSWNIFSFEAYKNTRGHHYSGDSFFFFFFIDTLNRDENIINKNIRGRVIVLDELFFVSTGHSVRGASRHSRDGWRGPLPVRPEPGPVPELPAL